MLSALDRYATAFLLTIVVEVAVALGFGFRSRSEIASVVWVNVFSHPLLCRLLWTFGTLRSGPVTTIEVLLLEACVVLVEWRLLRFALRRHPSARLLLLSLAMNGTSYAAGAILL